MPPVQAPRAREPSKPLGAALPPPPLPSLTGMDVAPGRAGNTAVASLEAPAALAARPATDLLNDAVLRHPASRQTSSSLASATPARVSQAFNPAAVPSVPRSTETQPNKSDEARESRRRKLTVAAILTGAFGVGVGGAATGHEADAAGRVAQPALVAAAPLEPVAAGSGANSLARAPVPTSEPATETRMGAAVASARAPEAPVQAPAEAAVAVVAGRSAGEALALAPIDDVAPAPVAPAASGGPLRERAAGRPREGGRDGPRDHAVRRAAGSRQAPADARAAGLEAAALDFELLSLPGAGPVLKKVVLEPVAVAPAPGVVGPRPQPRPAIPGLTPTTHPTPPIYTSPVVRDPPPAQLQTGNDGRKPTVKLLDEGEPGGTGTGTTGKKPAVKLLDEDETPPPATKPKVKVLGE
ncbi:MAG: hypothetical protein U1F43_33065 [Myxococcota bacterium]